VACSSRCAERLVNHAPQHSDSETPAIVSPVGSIDHGQLIKQLSNLSPDDHEDYLSNVSSKVVLRRLYSTRVQGDLTIVSAEATRREERMSVERSETLLRRSSMVDEDATGDPVVQIVLENEPELV